MRECLFENEKRKIVLILDNIDRVSREQALAIWGTLQTFLQNRNFHRQPWFKQLWVVVPYDPSGLKKLWGDFPSNPTSPNNIDEAKVIEDSFIDKSFQIRFEVPPLVLSNWRKFLINLLTEALPKHSENGQTVYQIYNHGRMKKGETPTPRELKLFINQIGALHRQWGDHYPICHLAYYVSLRRRDKDIIKNLIEGIFPETAIEALVEPALRENLAGLTFNVEANLGLQFLLSDPIRDALTDRKPEDLVNLEEQHGPGFWAVLEQVLSEKLTEGDAKFVSSSAWCLNNSGLLENEQNLNIREIITILEKAGNAVITWKPFSKNLSEGCASLLRLISSPDFTKEVLRRVKQTISQIETKGDNEIDSLLEGIVILDEVIQDLGHSQQLEDPFQLKVDAETWETICVKVLEEKPALIEKMKPQIRGNEISNYIGKCVIDGEISQNNFKVIEGTEKSPIEPNWDTLAEALGKRLDAAQVPKIPGSELSLLLEVLSLLRRYNYQKATDVSARICNPGHLLHFFSQIISEANPYCKAYCIATFLQQIPNVQKPKAIGNSEAGHTHLINLLGEDDEVLASEMIKILDEEENLDLLLEVVDKRGQYDPLVLRCLRELTSERPETVYNSQVMIDTWQGLLEHLDEGTPKDKTFEGLVRHLCEKDALTNMVMNQHGTFQPDAAKFYLTILKVGETDSFNEWCIQGLKNLNADQWLEEIKQQGDLLKLLFYLLQLRLNVNLTFQYKDALLKHAKELIEGETLLHPDLLSKKEDLLNAMEDPYRINILPQSLLDLAKKKNGVLSKDFLDMYGNEISDERLLAEDSEVVRRLFVPIIINPSKESAAWLKNTLTKSKESLKGFSDKHEFQEFKHRLQGYLDGTTEMDSESGPLIQDIASLIGIEPQTKEPKEGPNSSSVDAEDS